MKVVVLLVVGMLSSLDAQILAQVGDRAITRADLATARQRLPQRLRRNSDQWLLETLVTRELLVQEAERQGLRQDAQVHAQLVRASRAKLRDLLFDHKVVDAVSVSDADVRKALSSGAVRVPREVRVAHIVVSSRELADSLHEQLSQGAEFGELARKYSLDKETASRGGDLGYWREGEVIGPVAARVWSLADGEISEPVAGPGGRYYLLTVKESASRLPDTDDELVRQRVRTGKIRLRRRAYGDSLWDAYGARIDSATLDLLVLRGKLAQGRIPVLEADDSTRVLVRYRSGTVDLRAYAQWLRNTTAIRRLPYPWLHDHVRRYVRSRAITDVLYPAEARVQGLDDTLEFKTWWNSKEEDLMIDALQAREVEARVLDPQAIAACYAARRDTFGHPERLIVEALVTADPQLAEECRTACERGGDLAMEARRISAEENQQNYWVFWFSPQGGNTHGREVQALANAARGITDWQQPQVLGLGGVGVDAAYGVFNLLKRVPAGIAPSSDPAVRAVITRILRRDLADKLEAQFKSYVSQLRTSRAEDIRYADSR